MLIRKTGNRVAAAGTCAVAALALWAGPAWAGKPTPTSPPPSTTATSYSGDAQVVDAHVDVLPLLGTPVSADVDVTKVGPLPSTGGFLHDSLLTVNAGVAPYLGVLGSVASAATVGSGDRSHSAASVAGVSVGLHALGLDIDIAASILRAHSNARCGSAGAEVSGGSSIAGLVVRVGGLVVPVNVGTGPNQVINLTLLGIPIATLTLNEQQISAGSITVSALHLSVPQRSLLGGVVAADVVISRAHSDITCQSGGTPPPCQALDFVTGGGQIPGAKGGTASFGLVGGQKPNGLAGHFNLVDHGTGQHIKGTELKGYTVIDATTRKLTYAGTIDDVPTTITVFVSDKGEPGTSDTLTVSTTSGYSAAGTPIANGNLQLHQPQGCGSSTGGGGKKH